MGSRIVLKPRTDKYWTAKKYSSESRKVTVELEYYGTGQRVRWWYRTDRMKHWKGTFCDKFDALLAASGSLHESMAKLDWTPVV